MSHEIELKAWVDDDRAVRASLARIAVFECEYVKEDEYWFPEDAGALPQSGLRVRREKKRAGDGEKDTVLVTYKTKEVRERIEVNRESEFVLAAPENATIDAAVGAFEELLERLRLRRSYTKRKRGFLYKSGELSAELSFIEGLGWFLELEIIAPDDEAATVAAARETLLDFLGRAGIACDKIEPKYYSELLRERGRI